jgi:hypothetical protein
MKKKMTQITTADQTREYLKIEIIVVEMTAFSSNSVLAVPHRLPITITWGGVK